MSGKKEREITRGEASSPTCMTNSRRRGRPRSVTRLYSGSFSFLACCIWASLLMGFMPWPYSGLVGSYGGDTEHMRLPIMTPKDRPPPTGPRLTFTIDLVFFLMRGFIFSTAGSGGSFFSSSRTAMAAFFLDTFLLFPSPSPTNSPTSTLVIKLFMCGGPDSLVTCRDITD